MPITKFYILNKRIIIEFYKQITKYVTNNNKLGRLKWNYFQALGPVLALQYFY